ncbi:LysR substrate-binding domain-containing protein [Mangrovicella endophytica]|uniref:LysR substrate-binding domain-containing protein n=1 Tax=Mangrovicella endophytica TaxID=2066697 RepID=UPI001FDF618A|nr:LysR substrate-binding domain-containing protein [Mangrovicella endophytica]
MRGKLNLRQIEAFRAVMLTGGMTAAGTFLSITQPAVSRLIRDFEDATGLSLFDRRGNQLVPRPAAVALMAEVERSFVGIGQIAAMAEGIARHSAGSLRIAAMPALASGVLARFAAVFQLERPGLHIVLRGLPSHLVIEAVASGQADLGFAEGPWERSGFTITALESAAVVVMPESHRLADQAVVQPADLAQERFVSLGRGTVFAARIEAVLGSVSPVVVAETSLSHTACAMVAAGAGLSIIDAATAADYIGRGLVARPLGALIDAGCVSIRLASRPRSELEERFESGFRDVYREAGLAATAGGTSVAVTP